MKAPDYEGGAEPMDNVARGLFAIAAAIGRLADRMPPVDEGRAASIEYANALQREMDREASR